VTGPENLVLAAEGDAVDVTVAAGTPALGLGFKVAHAKEFNVAAHRPLAARIVLLRRAGVTATLLSPRGVKLATWRFTLNAGRSIVSLRIPTQISQTGLYSLRWTATAGDETLTRIIGIRFYRGTAGARRAKVVLAGSAVPRSVPLPKSLAHAKVVATASEDMAFDLVAAGSNGVEVAVVDVDELGLRVVRDLHRVFPRLRIVALARTPKLLVASLRAGARVALPSSTRNSVLGAVVSRLLRGR
jgi:hypothetical protein